MRTSPSKLDPTFTVQAQHTLMTGFEFRDVARASQLPRHKFRWILLDAHSAVTDERNPKANILLKCFDDPLVSSDNRISWVRYSKMDFTVFGTSTIRVRIT